jgi:CBS domain-containing protein
MPSRHTTFAASDAALAKLEANMDALHLGGAPARTIVTVGEIMTENVATCMPHETLEQCAQLMWDRACGCVPIVDDDDHPIAIVTDRDVCMAAYTQGKPLSSIQVATVMSLRVHTVGMSVAVPTAEAIMRRQRVRRLPVVDNLGRIVGILSFSDIVLHTHLEPGLSGNMGDPHTVAETLACVSHVLRRSNGG